MGAAPPLGPDNKALLDFAKKVTLFPKDMKKTDIENLREHGFDDRAII